MNIQLIINELNNHNIQNSDIKYIFKTGSYAFIDDYRDYDFLVILNDEYFLKKTTSEKNKRISTSYNETNVDIFIESNKTLTETLSYEKNTRLSSFILLFIRQEDTLIYGSWSENFNFLQTQNDYIHFISKNIKPTHYKKYGFIHKKENGDNYTVPKGFWWTYIPILMIKNKSTQITSSMLKIIQDSRNRVLSDSLKDEVRVFLNLEDDSVPFDSIYVSQEQRIIDNLSIELSDIQNWFLENDWIPNKIIRKEWTEQDSRWIDYINQCQIKRTRQDEIKNILGIN